MVDILKLTSVKSERIRYLHRAESHYPEIAQAELDEKFKVVSVYYEHSLIVTFEAS